MSYNISQNKKGGKKYKVTFNIESELMSDQLYTLMKEQLIYLRRKEIISAIKSMDFEELK